MKILLCFFLSLCPLLIQGQEEGANQDPLLLTLQAKINQFIAQKNKDSLAYYYQKRIDHFQQKDNISEYIYGYCYDFYYDVCDTSPDCILPYLAAAEKHLWRVPKTREDSLAFLVLYRDLGLHLMNLGHQVPKAKQVLEKAKGMLAASRNKDTLSYNIVFKSLGNAYTILGDNERAIGHFRDAINNPIFTKQNQAGNYLNLAISYWNKNEMEASNRAVEKGLALEGIGANKKGRFYSQLATNALEEKDYNKALAFGEKALAFFEGSAGEDRAMIKYILANVFLGRGEFQLAEANIVEALRLRAEKTGRRRGKFYITYSQVLLQQKKWGKALIAANEALACVLPDFDATALYTIPAKTQIYPENTILEALEAKAQILQVLFRQKKQARYLESASDCHALAFEVEQLLRQNYLYESSKLDLLADSRRRTEAAIAILLERYALKKEPTLPKTAFQFAENSKSIVLLDAVKRNSFLSKLLAKDSLVQRERELLGQKRFFEQARENNSKEENPARAQAQRTMNLELEKLQVDLLEKYPAYQQSLRQETIETCTLLKEESILLEFFQGEKNTYLFLVTANQNHFFEIGESTKLDTLIQSYLSFFSSKNEIENAPKAYQRKAHHLYQILFPEAVRKMLQPKEEWIIIPDGSLNFIPFEALVTSEKESHNLGKVDYVIKSHTIQYAYSARVLEQQNQRHSQNKEILAMAPVFEQGERGQIPLPYSKEEVQIFKTPLLAKQATLEAFNQRVLKSQLIHLSTHAKVEHDGQARIEFIDSTLFLNELYTMRLDADLVILSACETGIGTLQKGEGLMSLGRGFAYAGAASLVASLWPVQDASTAWLIEAFYKNLENGQSKSEALRQAKLQYLSQPEYKKSPYYWSVLTFIGANQTLSIQQKGFSWWWIGLGFLLCLLIWKIKN